MKNKLKLAWAIAAECISHPKGTSDVSISEDGKVTVRREADAKKAYGKHFLGNSWTLVSWALTSGFKEEGEMIFDKDGKLTMRPVKEEKPKQPKP